MALNFAPETREMFEQLVHEPRFRALTKLPVFPVAEIGLICAAYGLFALGCWLYLAGHVPWVVALLVNGFAVYMSFTPLHDATHRSLSSNRLVNDTLGSISSILMAPGFTTGLYRYLHLEHHRHSGDPVKDPDEPFVSDRWWQLPFTLCFPEVLWAVWYARRWKERPLKEQLLALFFAATFVGWHVVWLLSPWAWEFLILWVVPERLGLFLVTWFFAHIQHPEGVTWERAPIQATVHVNTPGWVRVLLLGQSQHFMHHFVPALPYYRYHRAVALGEHLLSREAIPQRTLFTPAREIPVPAAAASWLRGRCVRIEAVGRDVKRFEFEPADGSEWPAFSAGAHVDVELGSGMVRQYSLCGDPADDNRYTIAVKREEGGRGGSKRMHELTVGDEINLSAPRNHFPLQHDQEDYVLVAGGIGITPLLAMARQLHAIGKPFTLHLFARDAGAAPFREQFADMPFAEQVHVHLDDAAQPVSPADVVGDWRDGRGLYVCGPAPFMAAVMQAARARRWPDAALSSESFLPPRLDRAGDAPFEVELRRSGRTLTVGADESLLDVLNANDQAVPSSCTQGLCGACVVPVLEGEIEHRDVILNDADVPGQRRMCSCVSRARGGRIVLDL